MQAKRAPPGNGEGRDTHHSAQPSNRIGLDNHSNDNSNSTTWRRGEVWPIGLVATDVLARIEGPPRIAGRLRLRWSA
jgi:hypothetical protein